MEGKSIEIIDITSSSKMEHISTTGRGVASNKGAIPTHNIRVGEGDDVGSGNGADIYDNSILLSSSLFYLVRTTKQTREEILQHRVVCVKRKHGPEGSRERNIHHSNATKALLQIFLLRSTLFPITWRGSKSNNYTNIQSEYVANFSKIKLFEARIMV